MYSEILLMDTIFWTVDSPKILRKHINNTHGSSGLHKQFLQICNYSIFYIKLVVLLQCLSYLPTSIFSYNINGYLYSFTFQLKYLLRVFIPIPEYIVKSPSKRHNTTVCLIFIVFSVHANLHFLCNSPLVLFLLSLWTRGVGP